MLWRRRLALAAGLLVVGGGAAAGVAALVGDGGRGERAALARAYAAAWARQDWAAMHRLLTPASRRALPLRRFAALGREQLRVATATAGPRLDGEPEVADERVRLRLRVPTVAFGTVRAPVAFSIDLDGDATGVRWQRALSFPGLRRGERLNARTELPPRATLLAADGGVLAAGAERAPDEALADVAAETVGMLGSAEEPRAAELQANGVPTGAQTGLNGLEHALDDRLIGTPGGTLLAGSRMLARSEPRQADPVRTTIVPSVVRATASALGGRPGGAVALDPRSGALLGYAGVPFSGVRAPGSTFKLITLASALEHRVTTPDAQFPYETEALLDGAPLQNAHGELCGGSLAESFAHSCNSVFAPMGAAVGADRLAATARRFGFDAPSDIPGAATSTMPDADDGTDPLTVGSSAIGQGDVRATALQMASAAATIARGGTRPLLTLDGDLDADTRAAVAEHATHSRRAVSGEVARVVQDAMLAVVEEGTGGAAAIDDVPVAGKTGTAELGIMPSCTPDVAEVGLCDPDDPTDTDAWFVAYAPATQDGDATGATVAVAVVLMQAGAGGDTAAPVAREIIAATLEAQAR